MKYLYIDSVVAHHTKLNILIYYSKKLQSQNNMDVFEFVHKYFAKLKLCIANKN